MVCTVNPADGLSPVVPPPVPVQPLALDLLLQAVAACPGFVAVSTARGELLFANEGLRQLLGLSAAASVDALELEDCLAAQSRSSQIGQLLDTLQHGQVWQEEVLLQQAGRGEMIPASCKASPVLGAGGELQAIIFVATDLREHYRLRRLAKETTRTLQIERDAAANERANVRNLFDHAPLFFSLMRGPEHILEYVSPAGRRIFGDGCVLGQRPAEAAPYLKENGFSSLLDYVYRSGETKAVKEGLVMQGQNPGYFGVTCSPHYDVHGVIDGVMVVGLDVSEVVQARTVLEQATEHAEEDRARLLSAFEKAPVGINIFRGPQHVYELVNERYRAFVGDRQFLGRSVWEVAPEIKLSPFHGLLDEVYQSGERQTARVPMQVRCDGGVRDGIFDIMLQPLFDEHGRVDGILQVSIDVTVSVTSLEALKRSQEELALVVKTSRVGFYEWDFAGNWLTLSSQMRSDWGLDPARELFSPDEILERIPPDDRERVNKQLEATMVERSSFHLEYRVDRPDGRQVWMEARHEITYHPDGQPERLFGTCIDITERKNTEAAQRLAAERLQFAEERMRRATEAAKAGIWDLDLVHNRLDWSPQTKRIFGLAEDDLIDYEGSFAFVVPSDQQKIRDGVIAASDYRGNGLYGNTYQIVTKDGIHKWVQAVGEAQFSSESGGEPKAIRLCGVVLDVTEEVRLKDDLKASKVAAEAANAVKSAFLANVSHEIRTPLGIISGYSEFLLDPQQTVSDRLSCAQIIRRNVEQLTTLVNELLDLSKVEADKLEIELTPINVSAFMQEIYQLTAFKASEKGIGLKLSCAELIRPVIYSDPTRLRQILLNVIGNAIKFTDRGGVEVETRLSPSAQEGLVEMEIVVSDTGVGLTAEEAERIWSPFVQADASTTRRFGGTGLGLSLARRLAQALGGDLHLEASTVGVGSRFKIKIVAQSLPEQLESSQIPATPAQAGPALGGKRLEAAEILVVEDSPDNQILVTRLLESEGATVFLAANGMEGVSKIRQRSFDVVLMDMQMPCLDGAAATARLRAEGYSGVIIAFTANAMKGDRERCLAQGFNDYLAKPIDRLLLIEKTASYVRQVRSCSGSVAAG